MNWEKMLLGYIYTYFCRTKNAYLLLVLRKTAQKQPLNRI